MKINTKQINRVGGSIILQVGPITKSLNSMQICYSKVGSGILAFKNLQQLLIKMAKIFRDFETHNAWTFIMNKKTSKQSSNSLGQFHLHILLTTDMGKTNFKLRGKKDFDDC